jgi:hypothetical protein
MGKLHDTFDDLAEYRARVEAARLNRSGETIYNSSHRHAAVLIEQLFIAAEREVKIICRGLCPRSFGNPLVLEAAERFLAQDGVKLRIIAEELQYDAAGANPFFDRFRDHANAEIIIGMVHTPFDFFVADGKAWRYEADASKSVARASFNDPTFGALLDEAFDIVTQLRAA